MPLSAMSSEAKREGETRDDFKRQGSFRKLLPANTNVTQLSMSAKMIDRPNIAQDNKEHAIFLQEYNILSEYNMLRNEDLKGIYVIPSARNPFLWFGVHFARQGIYQGGVFRFTVTLPACFPDEVCPKVVFQTKVFHPLVHPESGELYVTWGFPEWRRNNRVWQLIQFIIKVFAKIDLKMTPINGEASALLENDAERFQEKAKESVKSSLNRLYDPPPTDDPHYITFGPYDGESHDPIRRQIYEPKDDENRTPGLSWVQPGSLRPFSKPETR